MLCKTLDSAEEWEGKEEGQTTLSLAVKTFFAEHLMSLAVLTSRRVGCVAGEGLWSARG